jgi:Tat protein secretion system quality control protein TatD with DNase activity
MKNQIISEEFHRMQELAGLLKENQNNSDIISFLEQNKQEILKKVAKKLEWDEDDLEEYNEEEITIGADYEGNEDPEIAGFGEGGLDFSFNPDKVKDVYGDAFNFKLIIAGKPVYGISYNI